MAKKKKKQRKAPNLSPITLLRPRLDGLVGNPGWAERDGAAIYADLDRVTKGIQAIDYLPVLLRVVANADESTQQSLHTVVPAWLEQNNSVDGLVTLLEQDSIPLDTGELAFEWLRQAGVDPEEYMQAPESTFYDAYSGEDSFGDQGLIFVFWYSNRQRSRVAGMSFMLDFHPPWEGAVKDVMALPQKRPKDAIREFVGRWEGRDIHFKQLSATEAKEEVIEALEANRDEEIRIHRDFLSMRDDFIHHILSLPDGETTPPFSVDDLDTVCNEGKSTESIVQSEQNIGRRVRDEEGNEIFLAAGEFGQREDDEY